MQPAVLHRRRSIDFDAVIMVNAIKQSTNFSYYDVSVIQQYNNAM